MHTASMWQLDIRSDGFVNQHVRLSCHYQPRQRLLLAILHATFYCSCVTYIGTLSLPHRCFRTAKVPLAWMKFPAVPAPLSLADAGHGTMVLTESPEAVPRFLDAKLGNLTCIS